MSGWDEQATRYDADSADMYASVITISLIGFALDRLFLLARGWLLAWSAEEEAKAA